MPKNREIIECFKRYRSLQKDDYTLEIPPLHSVNESNEKLTTTTHTFIPKHSDRKSYYTKVLDEIVLEKKEDGSPLKIKKVLQRVVDKELVDRLSPDNIDSTEFWKEANKSFPLFSICGHPVKNKEEANNVNNLVAKQHGAVDRLSHKLNDYIRQGTCAKILEIGPGFGNIYELLKDHSLVDYWSIDVYPLFDHDQMYLTDGKTIPEHIDHIDVVYAINVFQHLSKKQRSSYYKQIFNRLNAGGEFIFNMFVRAPFNEHLHVWGCRDENDRFYTMFFRQLTEVDHIDELLSELRDVGFSTKIITPEENLTKHNTITFSCTK